MMGLNKSPLLFNKRIESNRIRIETNENRTLSVVLKKIRE